MIPLRGLLLQLVVTTRSLPNVSKGDVRRRNSEGRFPNSKAPHAAGVHAGLRAILHVGPHKIGSSSLQSTIWTSRESLAADKISILPEYSFDGRIAKGYKSACNVAYCLLRSDTRTADNLDRKFPQKTFSELYPDLSKLEMGEGNDCTEVLAKFSRFLDGARRAGHGIVLASECFADPHMNLKALADALHGFETLVAVMHRPFFEWFEANTH